MSEAAAFVVGALASLDPVLAGLGPPLGGSVHNLEVARAVRKLALVAIRAVAARLDERRTQLGLVQLGVDIQLVRSLLARAAAGKTTIHYRAHVIALARKLGAVTTQNGRLLLLLLLMLLLLLKLLLLMQGHIFVVQVL